MQISGKETKASEGPDRIKCNAFVSSGADCRRTVAEAAFVRSKYTMKYSCRVALVYSRPEIIEEIVTYVLRLLKDAISNRMLASSCTLSRESCASPYSLLSHRSCRASGYWHSLRDCHCPKERFQKKKLNSK